MLISAANIPPSYRQSSTSWGAELDPGTESVYILRGQAVPRGRPMRGWARLLAFLQENPAMREDVDLCTPGLCRGWRRNEGGQMVATLVVSSWKHDTEDGDPHPTLSSFVLSIHSSPWRTRWTGIRTVLPHFHKTSTPNTDHCFLWVFPLGPLLPILKTPND